jgi:hypothetical protein
MAKNFTTDATPAATVLTGGADDVVGFIDPISQLGNFNFVALSLVCDDALTDFAVQEYLPASATWIDYLRATAGDFTATNNGSKRAYASANPAGLAADTGCSVDFQTNIRKQFRFVATGVADSTFTMGAEKGNR